MPIGSYDYCLKHHLKHAEDGVGLSLRSQLGQVMDGHLGLHVQLQVVFGESDAASATVRHFPGDRAQPL